MVLRILSVTVYLFILVTGYS